ncbi:MogA/MoaB family molybdenum cofactor biosynthesis protein [Faecalicatena sp. Marseille-Q4148]|nr:MogA/MoaB family molybdenum cofactor biosynthesis protein [Faecalicatena sp. Marseille-Q4148]
MRAAIITASTKGYQNLREDLSGPEIEKLLVEAGFQVVSAKILPDDRNLLGEEMRRIADEGLAELLLTTGGTGFAPSDVTPEATEDVAEKLVPGIPEAMRYYSMQFTKRAMLSRAQAGIRKQTLIINLPGSPKAVRECLEYILPELTHGIQIMTGETGECARTN